MMIKTLDNVYINMEDFSGFTIGYPNDFDFTVMAMKELVDNQTAAIELGRYPSEKEAKDALKKMIEHQDDIKKAEFFGREEGFYYISNIFTRLSDRYAEFLKKNRIKYYDRLCGFEREQYLSGYGFMQGYFDIDKVLEQLKKEGFAKVLFSWLYDTRQYDKCMDGCYMEITKVS